MRISLYRRWGFAVPAIVVLATAVALGQGARGVSTEWRDFAGDARGSKYSPLDQINRDNVKDLKIAWRWRSDNFGPFADFNLQATPLVAGDVLYTTAGRRRDVVAIDSATGETLWFYRLDEGERGNKAPLRAASGRGVAYWTDGRESRIVHVTQGYQLVVLDAKTGLPVSSFGHAGIVDLFQELDRPGVPEAGVIGWNSPPIVVGNVIVIGSAFGNSSLQDRTIGHIRGYDIHTGKRLWIFHTVPRVGEFGSETWEKDSSVYAGNVGAWAPMAADLELGYVYVPVESASTDTSGQHRPGSNLFEDSLVCLDAKTGKRIWHFQLVHHGLWDYDPPAQPILVDVTVNGQRIRAVVQVTKQAFAYVFDRVTGKPVWPIEERPVPVSDVPGEKSFPTQPFPIKPAAFDRQGITADDLIDFTPALKEEAIKFIAQYRTGPLYTPPSVVDQARGFKGTLILPGLVGGANWQGGAVDPETGMLYVPSITMPMVAALRPCDPERTPIPTMKYCGGGGAMGDVSGLPPIKPPWGRITAIDLNTGEHAWMIANGDTPDYVKNHPALKGLTIPRTGRQERSGLLVTKTLLFAGEGSGLFAAGKEAGGTILRAHDKMTGATISEFVLPARQTGAPMSYMRNGKQYIVIATGSTNQPAEFVALSLP